MGLFTLAKQAQNAAELGAKAAQVLDGLKNADENNNKIPDGIEILGHCKNGFDHLAKAKEEFEKASALAGDNIEHVIEVLGINLPGEMPKPESESK